MRNKTLVLCAAAFALLFAACETVPEPSEIPEDLSTQEYFQRAQEAVDQRHFETALVYYRTFLDRYPDDVENRIAAQYEIAFLHYKMEDYDTAEELFEELLARYEGEEAAQLPAWPRILAEKLIEKIEEEREAELLPEEA
jgi:outer membrane protein assembly factor BamD (BamD/ComL family)